MDDPKFAQCMAQISQGNKDALREIYEEYMPWLYSVVYGILQQKETAEDVTSELFLRIWNTAGQYKAGNGHKGYLATIARHMAIDELRKHKKETLAGPDEDEEGTDPFAALADDQAGPEEVTVQDMSLREALDKLKPAEREVVSMKILSEMTFQEIADATGISIGTISWRYQSAIKKLRKCGYE